MINRLPGITGIDDTAKTVEAGNGKVFVCRTRKTAAYPEKFPWNPPESFPELPEWAASGTDPSNQVYRAVRNALRSLELDADNYGTPEWNPLSDIISPGDSVLIKPNMVRHYHGRGLGLTALVTHVSFMRVVIDYVIKALDGTGSVAVGDAPLQECDFPTLVKTSGLGDLLAFYRANAGFGIDLVDFRQEMCIKDASKQYAVKRKRLAGDPKGYREVDLGGESFLVPLEKDYNHFRVTNYDSETMMEAHRDGHHKYLLSGTMLEADVIINIPKLKTHRKAGLTASMKNFIGVNGSKDMLPHHRAGSKLKGHGDEYLFPSIRKQILSILTHGIEKGFSGKLDLVSKAIKKTGSLLPFNDSYIEGSWYGNDTIWRTILDINRAVTYADRTGKLSRTPQRKVFSIVDAIVCGEGEGPMEPTPRAEGLVIAGFNRVAVDYVCALAAGFSPEKISYISAGLSIPMFDLKNGEEIRILYHDLDSGTATPWSKTDEIHEINPVTPFEPPKGWKGYLD